MQNLLWVKIERKIKLPSLLIYHLYYLYSTYKLNFPSYFNKQFHTNFNNKNKKIKKTLDFTLTSQSIFKFI